MSHINKISIKAPREKVFQYLSNPEKMKFWMGGQVRTLLSEGFDYKNPVGKTFSQEFGSFALFDGVVTTYHPPELLSTRIYNAMGVLDIGYRLEGLNSTTELKTEFSWPNSESNGAIKNYLQDFVEMIVEKHLKSLKEICEKAV